MQRILYSVFEIATDDRINEDAIIELVTGQEDAENVDENDSEPPPAAISSAAYAVLISFLQQEAATNRSLLPLLYTNNKDELQLWTDRKLMGL